MIYLKPERCERGVEGLRCPTCDTKRALAPHGSYVRPYADLAKDGTVVERTTMIKRGRCRVCGRTHALVPTTLLPGRHASSRLAMEAVALSRRLRGAAAAARRLGMGERTCQRLALDAGRLRRLLSSPAEELAEAIEAVRDEVAVLCAMFARAYGTAPFSRVTLLQCVRGMPTPTVPQHGESPG